MAKKKDTESVKTQVLTAALPNVPFDGWNDDLLMAAAKTAKIKETVVHEIFPRGVLDLVVFFSTWADSEMLKKLPQKKMDKMRVRDRITAGVQARLEILTPYKEAVAASLKFLAPLPRHLQVPKMVWATADAIWRRAGDTATDYNHYSKRILLSGVLTSTTLYWLNDDSDDFEKTHAFLDKRINNVLSIGKFMGKFKKRKPA